MNLIIPTFKPGPGRGYFKLRDQTSHSPEWDEGLIRQMVDKLREACQSWMSAASPVQRADAQTTEKLTCQRQ